jgi:predicted MFS family arabinose efflux permease
MTDEARRGRWAVAAVFAMNGFMIGAWAPQIPLLLSRLAITESVVGLLILVFGLGAIVAMPLCGLAMSRMGSRPVLIGFAALSTIALPAVVFAPNPWIAGVAMLAFGAVIGGTDVAMNSNAVTVERRLGRAIMSSTHGFWSLGGFAGSALGGLVVLHLGAHWQALAVMVVSIAVLALAAPRLVVDQPKPREPGRKLALPSDPLIYLVGLMALFSMIPEGAVLDWAALYLQQELGTDIATASFAFAAFSGAMALMRFMGDGIRGRLGAVRTLRVSAVIAAIGLALAGTATSPLMAITAFCLCGLGIANMVPIAFSAAGNHPGMASSTGMSVATTMGYSGILLAPSAIGFIGERTGFAIIFVALAILLVAVFAMAGLARNADFTAHPAE